MCQESFQGESCCVKVDASWFPRKGRGSVTGVPRSIPRPACHVVFWRIRAGNEWALGKTWVRRTLLSAAPAGPTFSPLFSYKIAHISSSQAAVWDIMDCAIQLKCKAAPKSSKIIHRDLADCEVYHQLVQMWQLLVLLIWREPGVWKASHRQSYVQI